MKVEMKFLRNTKAPWSEYYVPKYIVTVNGYDFDYFGSAREFGDALLKHPMNRAFKVRQHNKNMVVREHDGVLGINAYQENRWVIFKNQGLSMPTEKQYEPDTNSALYALISDALAYLECFDEEEFIKMYGYEETYESIKRGEEAYKACERTFKKLGLSQDELYKELERLQDLGY